MGFDSVALGRVRPAPNAFADSPLDCSQDKPMAASGRYTNGEWKLLTGKVKIETVRIELDERQ